MPIRYDIDGTTYYHYLYTSKAGWVSECSSTPYLKVVKNGTTYYAPLTQTAPTAGSILRIPFKISIGGTNYYPLACALTSSMEYDYSSPSSSITVDIPYPSSAFEDGQTMQYDFKGGQGGAGKGGGGGGGAHRANVTLLVHVTAAASGGGGTAGYGRGATPTSSGTVNLTNNLTPGTTYQLITGEVGSGGTAGGGAGGGANDGRASGGGTTTGGGGGSSSAGGTGPSTLFKIKNGATLYSRAGTAGSTSATDPTGGTSPLTRAGLSQHYAQGGTGGKGGPAKVSSQNGAGDDAYNATLTGGTGQDSGAGGDGGNGGNAKTDSAFYGQDGYGHDGAAGSSGSTGSVRGTAYLRIDYWVKGA